MAKRKQTATKRKKQPHRFGKPGFDPDREHNSKPNRHRIRPGDMHQAMHTTKEDESRVVSHVPEPGDVLVFTMSGKQDDNITLGGNIDINGYPALTDIQLNNDRVVYAEDRDEACAKLSVKQTRTYYYIKRGPDGHFFNPIGLYDEGKHQKRHAGESVWKYREVNKLAFEYYLKFLQTRNLAWLRNAEREVV